MRIWKKELKEAYTLLSFSPKDTPLFAMELGYGDPCLCANSIINPPQ